MSAITAARAAELLAARTQTAHECAVLMMMEHPARNSSQRYLVCDALARRFSAPGGPLDALCAAYDAALADLHARLAQCEGERDALARWKRWTVVREMTNSTLGALVPFEVLTAAQETHAVMHEYGRLLRETRTGTEVRGAIVTMHDAAARAGCSVPVLSGVERGREPPFSDDVTRRLCAFLGCDPGPLLDAAAKCEEAMR